jgi:predicted TPR repeat methyltransferase
MSDPVGVPEAARFEAAKAAFFSGLESLKHGRLDEAERQFMASLAQVPGRISTLVNLAAVRLGLGKSAEALAAADEVRATEPDNVDALLHRATALGHLQRLDEARAGFARLVAIDARHAVGWLRLAQTLHLQDRRDEALGAYARTLALDAAQPDAWLRRGDLLREAGRLDEAADAFRACLKHGGEPALAGYYLAAVTGEAMPDGTPPAYVQRLFDDYAADFDRHLVATLGYQAPQRLSQRLAAHAPLARFESALDLGCGTGLCGPLLRPMTKRLVGVDLSGEMLAKARALGVYDELLQAELVTHLREAVARGERHDLIVAADVFIYVGELAPVFGAAAAISPAGACFAFSVEPDDAPASPGVRLLPSLRYAHAPGYLQALAAQHDFDVIAMDREPIRVEQARPIDGLYVLLRRR